jgi:quinol monooxygenase YgiN
MLASIGRSIKCLLKELLDTAFVQCNNLIFVLFMIVRYMTIIKKDNNVITLINVFTVDSSNQQRLVDILIETTEQVMNKQEGFISANIHKSLDGTHVVNYAQWESKEAFEKMLKNPKAIMHMNEVLTLAKADGSLYEVAFVEERTSNT